MKTSTIIAEYLIVGFVAFVLIGLVYLNVTGKKELEVIISEFKNISAGATILLSVILYILGIITHRMLDVVDYKSLSKLIKYNIISFVFSRDEKTFILNYNEKESKIKHFTVLNFASNAVTDRMRSLEGLMRIFKSVTFLMIPIAFLGLNYLLRINVTLGISYFILCLLLSYLSLKSHRLVIKEYIAIADYTFDVLILNNCVQNK